MIICCGEALIDFVPTKDKNTYLPLPGGSIFNIAIGLGRMGVLTGFLSRLSTDFFGTLLQNHLVENHVDLRYCPRVEGQTTLAFVNIKYQHNHEEPQYTFYAEGAVDRDMTTEDLPAHLPKEVTTLHFGSISLVLEPGASAFEALMHREKDQRIITLDPNVRPIVIRNWEAYRTRFESWLPCVDILRLSEVDLELLYPNVGLQELLPNWFEQGVKLMILTRGINGSIACLPDGVKVIVPSKIVKIKDTVGAGDTFFSAVLTHLYENGYLSSPTSIAKITPDELHKCLSFASLAAAINCTREGANPPYRYEIEEYNNKQ